MIKYIFFQDMEIGRFAIITTYDAIYGSMPVWIAVDDFNNNNQSDVVAINYGTNNALVLMDYFTKPSARQTNYHGGESGIVNSVAVSDFNGDAIVDIVFNGGNYIGILMSLGNSTFDKQIRYSTGAESITQYVCTGDVNSDNRTDIVIADIGLNGWMFFLATEMGLLAV